MKPKIFIGSSAEGLHIAYAIQQNLAHDAESTVWDQGVFNLSKTGIESLDEILLTMDYGIFAFSNDDITIMRGKESSSVRDNVLFELGLFIGKLGRDRVFFVVPEGSEIHIPTDLLGVNPGKFDPNREDGSLQAATGPLCNQIRIRIKKLGLLRKENEYEEAGKSIKNKTASREDWLDDFIKKDFTTAKKKLEKSIKDRSSDDIERDKAWLSFAKLKLNENSGLDEICKLSKENHKNQKIFKLAILFLTLEDYDDLAIELTKEALEKNKGNIEFSIILASLHTENSNTEKAIDILNKCGPSENPDVALALANILDDENKILELLSAAYKNSPNNQELVYEFAQKLEENQHSKEALYLFDFLASNYSDEYRYWGYLSNTCVSLDLYDKALVNARKAEKLSEKKEGWILMNVGNMLNNKGFYTEAISCLNNGLEIEIDSKYAHERLATAIENKEKENQKYLKLKKEGRRLLREANFTIE
jgi:predicted Zn-dependent protease